MNPKRLILAGSIVGVVIMVIAATLIVLAVTVWARPSEVDYRLAQGAIEEARDTGTPINDAFKTYVNSVSKQGREDKSYDEIVKGSAKERAAYKKEMAERLDAAGRLAKSKALRDEEVAAAYRKYRAQEDKYFAYTNGHIEAYPAYQSSFTTCLPIYSVTRETTEPKAIAQRHKELAADCLKDLDRLTVSSNKPYATYGKEFARIVRERQKNFDAFAADKISEAEVETRSAELAIESRKNDPITLIREARDKAGSKKEMKDLSALLEKKAASSE